MCPNCGSQETVKKGLARGIQSYVCKACGRRFRSTRKDNTQKLSCMLWCDYVFGKQTVKQLVATFDMDRRIVRRVLDVYHAQEKIHAPRPVHLVVDGTYFGERKEGRSWCAIVARDPHEKEDLLWSFEETETTSAYLWLREKLEELGYTILSVTGDGFSGIKTAFHGIPFQMCHVHMERLVTRKTTKNPQTEAGRVLLALTRSLHKTNSQTFHTRLTNYIEKYRDFLNERTIHPQTGAWSYTHDDLLGGLHRLLRHQRHLFTFECNKNIPKTTNSLEGHFRHTKKLLHIHHGICQQQAQKILKTIFLASTTAPNKKRLNEVL